MVNLPIGDMLAVRVVLSDLYRSGWIDNEPSAPFPSDRPGKRDAGRRSRARR